GGRSVSGLPGGAGGGAGMFAGRLRHRGTDRTDARPAAPRGADRGGRYHPSLPLCTVPGVRLHRPVPVRGRCTTGRATSSSPGPRRATADRIARGGRRGRRTARPRGGGGSGGPGRITYRERPGTRRRGPRGPDPTARPGAHRRSVRAVHVTPGCRGLAPRVEPGPQDPAGAGGRSGPVGGDRGCRPGARRSRRRAPARSARGVRCPGPRCAGGPGAAARPNPRAVPCRDVAERFGLGVATVTPVLATLLEHGVLTSGTLRPPEPQAGVGAPMAGPDYCDADVLRRIRRR